MDLNFLLCFILVISLVSQVQAESEVVIERCRVSASCSLACNGQSRCKQACYSEVCTTTCSNTSHCDQDCGQRIREFQCKMSCINAKKCKQTCNGGDCDIKCESRDTCHQLIKPRKKGYGMKITVNNATCKAGRRCLFECEHLICFFRCDSKECIIKSKTGVIVLEITDKVKKLEVTCGGKRILNPTRSAKHVYTLCEIRDEKRLYFVSPVVLERIGIVNELKKSGIEIVNKLKNSGKISLVNKGNMICAYYPFIFLSIAFIVAYIY